MRGRRDARSWLVTFLRWTVTLGAFAYLALAVDRAQISAGFGRIYWLDTVIALALLATTIPLTAFRWYLLMRAFGATQPPSPAATLRLTLIAGFYNTVLPGGVGGDVVRGAATRDAFDGGSTAALTTVFIDRVMGLAGLLVLVSGLALVLPLAELVWLRLAGIAALAGVAALVAALFLMDRVRPRLGGVLRRVLDRVPVPRSLTPFLGALGLSVGAHLLLALGGHTLLSSMAPSVGVLDSLTFIPIAAATAFLPFTVSGLGVRETAFVALFRTVGVDEGTALAASLSLYFSQVALAAVGGLVTLRLHRHDRIESNMAAAK
jgi:glycosyltransferase 2 family protein